MDINNTVDVLSMGTVPFNVQNTNFLADVGGQLKKVSGDSIQKTSTPQAMLSDVFVPEKAYKTGDYCIYMNALYKFTADKAIGVWDGSKVVPCSVTNEIKQMNAHTLGNVTRLKDMNATLTADVTYIAVSDGYLNMYAKGGGSGYLLIQLNDKNIVIPQHSQWDSSSMIFIRKGMIIKVLTQSAQNSSVEFSPLI